MDFNDMVSNGIVGPKVYWTIDLPFEVPLLGSKIEINETMVISWVVMLLITGLCIFLTRNLKVEKISKRQAVAEWLVELADNFVVGNMGEKFKKYIPFIAALFATSIISNLISLLGVRSPTTDLNTEAAWAIVVFIMITATKIKTNGVGGYLKGYTEPIAVMTPFNVLSELATPIGMACRHFGNILSGLVINTLIYSALIAASAAVFSFLPGILAEIPFFSIGVPAVLSVYFDWFSGVMQAFIFCMLTAKYISNAAEG
jgi:F-type H+-transporting ATPase subunit a